MADVRAPGPGRSGEGVIGLVLGVVAMVIVAVPGVRTARMPESPVAPMPLPADRPRPEPGGRGQLVRSTGRRLQCPDCPVELESPSSPAVPITCRQSGSTGPILDLTRITDYNNQLTPTRGGTPLVG